METNDIQTGTPAQTGGNAGGGAHVDTSALDAEIQQVTQQICSGKLTPGTKDYNDLLARQTALYGQRHPGNLDEDGFTQEVNNPELQKAISLQSEALSEIKLLKELGFDTGRLPKSIQPHHVEGWRQQRLLAQENYKELTPLIVNDLQALSGHSGHADLFRGFMAAPDLDGELKTKICEVVVEHVYKGKEQRFKQSAAQ